MTPDTTPTVLEVSDLSVTFGTEKGEIMILDRVSFSLPAHRTLGIVGESGSGKTITALAILNLIPSPPLKQLSGRVMFGGMNLLTGSKRQLRAIRGKRIAYIFQEPMTALNPVLTIGVQIVEMILTHEAVDRATAEKRAVRLLEEVGIPSPQARMRNYPHQLSGGMRQRAMIAMALSCNPDILIADEPTTALDVTIQAQVLALFKSLMENRGMSIIFVTHDLGVIAEIADDVLVMREGRVVEYAGVRPLFSAPQHPYTQELLALTRSE